MNVRIPGSRAFPLITPLVGFRDKIEAQVERFPYRENVFLMMKFRESNKILSDSLVEALSQAGLLGVRADDPEWNITKNVYNPLAVIYCCKYGIALFDEAEEGQAYSPNVAYELAIMQHQGKECLILRHASLPETPFDLIKDLHRPYSRDLVANQEVKRWIAQILPTGSGDDLSVPHGQDRRRAEVRSADGDLEVSRFRWKRARAEGSGHKIEWSLRVTNRGKTEITYRRHLELTDQTNFLLDDYTESSKAPLGRGKHSDHGSALPLEGELAAKLSSVVAHVYREEP